ncbi:E3 ubiquitin-protein ligase TRIM71-like [Ptychodera flava]|uniref:E3 ubiquitin-protein ligase TRIM71-like n=1 Tax=Ptychodera flava TaxID=63121 RepID=UPI003969BEBE
MSPRKRKWQGRDPGDMKVRMTVSEVVPERGRTVQEVEKDFYESDEVKMKTEEVGQSLDGQHDEMNVKGIGDGSISYTMSCQSLDALECLVGQYENGKLQDLMEDEFLSDELLDKIGAYYLAIDVTIDYEEYLMCRKELIQIYGLPSETNDQEQDTDKTRSMKSQEIDVYKIPSRVNRARDLLREFEMEGDKVTETQINTLDKLLQEKAQRRLLDHQQRLQESAKEVTNVHLLTDEEITEKNEDLVAKVNELTISSGIIRSQNRDRGRGREILQSVVTDGDRIEERKLNTIFSEFVEVKSETRDLVTNHPEVMMKAEKLSAYADHIVREAEIPEDAKEVYLDVRRAEKGHPVKGSVLEVFGSGSMPGQFGRARGIYIKKNGQWVICDYYNHRVQVIDPIQLCCDLILQFHEFPESFEPRNVTVDEDNDQYFMSDPWNGQVVVSSGQSKILNCFGRKERIDPTGICLSPDGFIFIGDWNGYVRKYNKSGEHIARTEKGQVSHPRDLIVNKKCIFVSDYDRNCVHVLNHQMQSIRDIGKGHLQGPYGLCFDHQQDGIYVCDVIGNRVVHFNCDGEFLSYKGQGQLEGPCYIALCKDNPYRLVVTQQYCIKLLYI